MGLITLSFGAFFFGFIIIAFAALIIIAQILPDGETQYRNDGSVRHRKRPTRPKPKIINANKN